MHLNGFKYRKGLNSSTWLIDKTPTGTTTPGQSGPGSNGNEEAFHIPQSSKTGASPSYGLVSYPRHTLRGWGCLTSEQRCNQHILQPQPNGLP